MLSYIEFKTIKESYPEIRLLDSIVENLDSIIKEIDSEILDEGSAGELAYYASRAPAKNAKGASIVAKQLFKAIRNIVSNYSKKLKTVSKGFAAKKDKIAKKAGIKTFERKKQIKILKAQEAADIKKLNTRFKLDLDAWNKQNKKQKGILRFLPKSSKQQLKNAKDNAWRAGHAKRSSYSGNRLFYDTPKKLKDAYPKYKGNAA